MSKEHSQPDPLEDFDLLFKPRPKTSSNPSIGHFADTSPNAPLPDFDVLEMTTEMEIGMRSRFVLDRKVEPLKVETTEDLMDEMVRRFKDGMAQFDDAYVAGFYARLAIDSELSDTFKDLVNAAHIPDHLIPPPPVGLAARLLEVSRKAQEPEIVKPIVEMPADIKRIHDLLAKKMELQEKLGTTPDLETRWDAYVKEESTPIAKSEKASTQEVESLIEKATKLRFWVQGNGEILPLDREDECDAEDILKGLETKSWEDLNRKNGYSLSADKQSPHYGKFTNSTSGHFLRFAVFREGFVVDLELEFDGTYNFTIEFNDFRSVGQKGYRSGRMALIDEQDEKKEVELTKDEFTIADRYMDEFINNHFENTDFKTH